MTITPPLPDDRTRQRLIILIIALAGFMGSLDVTIVNISLPTIAEHFEVSTATVSWVVTAYLLVMSSFLLAFGKAADIHGYRRIYCAGFIIFTAGSLLCGISGSIEMLIACRIMQAVGAAMFSAIGPAMVSAYLPKSVRGKALGYVGTLAGLGVAVGPGIGGFLSEYLSWHWIFFINIPIGIAAVAGSLLVIPSTYSRKEKAPFDAPGALLFFCALGTLLFALNMGYTLGWTSPLILFSLIITPALWFLFIRQERRAVDPLLALSFFKDRTFSLGNTGSLLIMLTFTGAIFLFPFYLEQIRGLATDMAGLVMMVPPIMMMVLGPVAGAASDRRGPRAICIGGAVVGAVAFFMFSMISLQTDLVYILISLCLLGISVGVFIAPSTSFIMAHSPAGKGGVASGVVMTVRDIGAVLGIVVFEMIFSHKVLAMTAGGGAATPASLSPALMMPGFQAAFLAGAVLCLIAAAAMVRTEKIVYDKRRED